MAHPIRPEKVMEMNNFYTLTVYEKGAEVIRMLHTLLGKQGFTKGMALYFERFDGQAVTCDDFVQAMADATSKDLSQFKLWYSQAGTPVVEAICDYDDDKQQFSLTLKQKHTTAGKPAMYIPVNFELIGNSGLSLAKQRLLILSEQQQTWTFDGVKEPATAALLGGFSAPVKLEQQLTDSQLVNLMNNASDAFCRWDCSQQLMINYIKQLVVTPDSQLPLNLVDAFAVILQQATAEGADLALLAEQLTMPSFNELSELIDEVDVDLLYQGIKKFQYFVASELEQQFATTYRFCTQASGAERRALAGVCLDYLSVLQQEEYQQLVTSQYYHSDNMTEQLAALKAASLNNLSCFNDLMAHYANRWQENTLVMDKWFSLKAQQDSETIYEQMAELLVHSKFSLENPNRARSLIGAFSNNIRYFHCLSGRGYRFLGDQLIKLNSINPQVASRLITPLIQYKSFDKQRQQLMLSQLQRLKALDDLSKDLQEKIDAALSA
jgi:aminopeptidase N